MSALNELAAQHAGHAPGDVRAPCPICAKTGRDDAVNITIKSDGSVVAHCHRCGENGTARPERIDGSRRPAARARATRPPEDHIALWESGVEPGEAFEHPYLTRKQVGAHGIRVKDDLLLVPMLFSRPDTPSYFGGVPHELVGVQKIAPDKRFADGTKDKHYTKGAKKTGAFHQIGNFHAIGSTGIVVVAEGYATAASIHEATGNSVAVAFDCGNLLHVAKVLREHYPFFGRITIAADDDHRKPGNPGMTAAMAAARAVGGLVAVPDFGADRPGDATDFNDLARHHGADAVRRCIAQAKAPDADDAETRDRDEDAIANGQTVVRVDRADTLTPQGIEWIWPYYLARRKLHSIAGPAGVNKTTLALAIAATITAGGRWPDGTSSEVGDVLMWSGEDGIEDTLLPRLIAHGADLSRFYFVRGTRSAVTGKRAFDPAADMQELTLKALRIPDLALLIVDPVVLTVRGDSNTNGDVRRGLQPVVELAEHTGAAAIGITHFSKGTAGKHPLERVTGSLAFGAAPRIVFAVAKMPQEQGGGRVMLRAKSNIGPDGAGFRFDVDPVTVQGIETIRILWRGPIDGDARDILAAAERIEDAEEREATDDAGRFLREIIGEAGGAMDRKSIIAAGRRAGYNERALERARSRAGVHSRTQGFGSARRSVWSLSTITDTPPPSQNSVCNDGNDGNDSLSRA